MSVRYDGKQKALILDLRWLIKLNNIISTVLLFTLITTVWLPLSCYRLASVSIHSFIHLIEKQSDWMYASLNITFTFMEKANCPIDASHYTWAYCLLTLQSWAYWYKQTDKGLAYRK